MKGWKATLTGLLCGTALVGWAAAAQAGPVILMGIDAEDGGPGGHGPISVYQSVGSALSGGVTNGGTGVVVIGGGTAGSQVRQFWDGVFGAANVTYVTGAVGVAGASFAGKAIIAVASSIVETLSGGLTDAENAALTGRAGDIASFVNGGGGLLGLTQGGLTNPFGYLGGLGAFSFAFPSYDNITPTAAGTAIGVTDSLDVCCWHNTFTAFPAYLDVLATDPGGQAAAIGGATVRIVPTVPEPATLASFGVGVGLLGWALRRRRSA